MPKYQLADNRRNFDVWRKLLLLVRFDVRVGAFASRSAGAVSTYVRFASKSGAKGITVCCDGRLDDGHGSLGRSRTPRFRSRSSNRTCRSRASDALRRNDDRTEARTQKALSRNPTRAQHTPGRGSEVVANSV
jgi:hypothetical protein